MNFRAADLNDINLVYSWVNDPLTRKNSYSTGIITEKEHEAWFKSKIKDEKCYFLIFTNDHKEPIGVLRFDDNEEDNWVVNINVAPNQRGRGYASIILFHGLEFIRSEDYKPVKAYVKKNNIYSIKAFQKVGFIKEKEIIYKKLESYLYLWK